MLGEDSVLPEQREQYEQPEQRHQSAQSAQTAQSAQPEQREQREQPEQREQYEQPEQREQREQPEQSEQSEQSAQFEQRIRDNSAISAAASLPQYATEQRLPFSSLTHSRASSQVIVCIVCLPSGDAAAIDRVSVPVVGPGFVPPGEPRPLQSLCAVARIRPAIRIGGLGGAAAEILLSDDEGALFGFGSHVGVSLCCHNPSATDFTCQQRIRLDR